MAYTVRFSWVDGESTTNKQSLENTKQERVELLRLKAGLLDVIPSTCSKCNKSIELGYVERQVESFDKVQLEAMMKSTEKIGLFCCNCLNEKNRASATAYCATISGVVSGDVLMWNASVGLSNWGITSSAPITYTTVAAPLTDIWTSRDIICTLNGEQIREIFDCRIHEEVDTSRLGAETIRIQKTVELRARATEQTMDLCGKTIEIQTHNRNEGRFLIERTSAHAEAANIIIVDILGRKIE